MCRLKVVLYITTETKCVALLHATLSQPLLPNHLPCKIQDLLCVFFLNGSLRILTLIELSLPRSWKGDDHTNRLLTGRCPAKQAYLSWLLLQGQSLGPKKELTSFFLNFLPCFFLGWIFSWFFYCFLSLYLVFKKSAAVASHQIEIFSPKCSLACSQSSSNYAGRWNQEK